MTGLFYKFNELGFPDKIKISNTEMCSLSAFGDTRTLNHARNDLISYLYDDDNPESWLIKYEENTIKEYGIYHFNYSVLLDVYSKSTGELQGVYSKPTAKKTELDQRSEAISAKNVSPSNTIQEDNVQDNKSSSSKDIVVQEEDDEENISERYNEFNITKRLIETHYDKTYFLKKGLMPKKRIMMKDIGEYPEESIVSAIEKVGLGLKNPERLIQFVLDELKITQLNNEPETEQPPRVATFVKSPRERAWIELINVPDWAYMSDFVETGKIPERQFATICTVLRTFFDHLENFEGFTEDYEKKYPGNIDTMKDMLTYINRKESEGNTDDSN